MRPWSPDIIYRVFQQSQQRNCMSSPKVKNCIGTKSLKWEYYISQNWNKVLNKRSWVRGAGHLTGGETPVSNDRAPQPGQRLSIIPEMRMAP